MSQEQVAMAMAHEQGKRGVGGEQPSLLRR